MQLDANHERLNWTLGQGYHVSGVSVEAWTKHNNKCVSKPDTNPPFAFQIAFPRGTDFTGFLQGGSKIRDLQLEISFRIESRIELADSRLQLQC